MRRLSRLPMLCVLILPTVLLSFAQAAVEDIAKHADPKVEVNQVFDAGEHGAVLVTSLNVMPNNDLLCITDVTKKRAAEMGVAISGRVATLGWISKDKRSDMGPSSLGS